MKCVKCNQEISTDSPFCGNCGEKVKIISKNCPGCGSSVAADMKFCGSCGATLEDKIKTSKKVKNSKPKEENTDVSAQAVETENVAPAVAEPTAVTEATKFCGGCGQPVAVDSRFCGSCGFVFTDVAPQVQSQPVMYQQPTPTVQPSEVLKKVKGFLSKYKVPLIIATSLIIIAVVGWTCFQKFYDFTKLSWVENYGDYGVEYTAATSLDLKVEAYDKEDYIITDIEYSVSAGTVEADGLKVTWYLPEEEGTYTITAKAPSGKKIEKEVNVIKIENIEEEELHMTIEKEEDPNADSDGDGLIDTKEQELGTNPYKADSDSDGLIDPVELEVETDPLKADTDNDGLRDGSELELGTDPLKEDSKGDGVKDGDREFTTEVNSDTVKMTITGTGDVTSTTIDVYENSTLGNTDGIIGKVYNFDTDSKIKEAKLVITYNEQEVLDAGLTEENLTFYNFNINTKELTPVETIVDTEANTITVTLAHFSQYVLADKNMINLAANTNILFVLDDSVSMYSEKQMIELGFDSSTGAIGSDTEFKRITLSEKLLNMLTGEYKYAVAEFSGTYYLYNDFTDSKSTAKDSLNQIRNMDHNEDGTDIVNALKKGVKEFDSDKDNNYIILLTDGKDTTDDLYYEKQNIITAANEKNVSICIIGLGNVDKTDLTDISEGTGCGFYYASDDAVLEDVYRQLSAEINYGQIDIDGDGKTDGTVIHDSGFIPSRDGFAFNNYSAKNLNALDGSCYGMATFANFFYRGVLPGSVGPLTEYNWLGTKVLGESNGYDFAYNSYFRDFDNTLYNYTMSEEYNLIFAPDKISDFWVGVEDGVLKVNDKYSDELKAMGAEVYYRNYKGSLKDIEKIEYYRIDVDADELDDYNSDDVNLFRAIYRWFIDQLNNDDVSFTTNPDDAFEYAVTSLENKNPLVLGYYYGDSGHAVNLIRIIVDNEDSNKFYFEVYDNNYAGESRYFEVIRTKHSKFALNYTKWTNDYTYDFSYIGKDYEVDIVELAKLDY